MNERDAIQNLWQSAKACGESAALATVCTVCQVTGNAAPLRFLPPQPMNL